ncbi:siderophore-interacting protein [Actinomadura kijaniata]|uniref:NADPH-dependent ferric siderophore reductase n=1 Tax=Actinomadura namibiensis TaxID=182080 RepID=A0A7W3LKL6_ACTNM|nr:siderophore-interacting protein [Actinomadura namibiensis]MBA8949802.1 NADPH-dependent ferric siderophore reductase [Actinomadura namibiensis]
MSAFDFFELRVLRTERLGPTLLRITLGGDRADEFVSGGRDQRFKLFLPHPHQETPVVPADAGEDEWFARWRAMDPAERAIMRTYTVRAQRPGEIDVDFALHGDGGPASRWAASARPGDPVTLIGPLVADNGGVDFDPPREADRILVFADETALPAAGGILEWLPSGTRAHAWIEVPHAADRQDFEAKADVEVTWLVRDEGGSLLDAVPAADLPLDGAPYTWIAGESGTVKRLRRHLVNERGLDRRSVRFMGYWRRGASEEDLLGEVLQGKDPHTSEE